MTAASTESTVASDMVIIAYGLRFPEGPVAL